MKTSAVAYCPEFFDAPDLKSAKEIILTPEFGLSTEERWERETNYLLDLIAELAPGLNRGSVVLDYGCGIGRLAKALIDRFGCCVIGADISAKMRAYAADYVDRPKFFALDPSALPLLGHGCADLVLAIWVLQHANKPLNDFAAIKAAMNERSGFFVVNDRERMVPACTEDGQCWITDGLRLHHILGQHFHPLKTGKLDPEVVTGKMSERTFWGLYQLQRSADLG